MSRFTQDQEPLGRFVGDEAYQLAEDLSYALGTENSGRLLIVPNGFQTDFASIPVFFQRILRKLDKHRRAAILHDWLYSYCGKVKVVLMGKQTLVEVQENFTRKQCDLIFLDAMEVLEVPTWKRQAMYWAVRSGGWVAWNGHTKRIAKQ